MWCPTRGAVLNFSTRLTLERRDSPRRSSESSVHSNSHSNSRFKKKIARELQRYYLNGCLMQNATFAVCLPIRSPLLLKQNPPRNRSRNLPATCLPVASWHCFEIEVIPPTSIRGGHIVDVDGYCLSRKFCVFDWSRDIFFWSRREALELYPL